MEKICLDTDVVLDFLCGEKSVVEKLKYYTERDQICITSFTLLQLHSAIRKPEVINAFISNVTVLPFDKNCGLIASRLINELKEKGVRLNIESILTAAICIENNALLFTKNRMLFEGIKQLKFV
jgi:predicted nucleic acid-binding protein